MLSTQKGWAKPFSTHVLENAVLRSAAKLSPFHQNSAAKKSKEQETWYGLPVIDWETYKKLSTKSIQKQEKWNELYTEFYKSVDLADLTGITTQQGFPNYAKAVENTQYIYIGETHDVPAIQQEIKQLLHAIRQVNPGKKILLATEFLQISHPLINPLHIDGKDWLIQDSGNYEVEKLADQLHFDTLALDDQIVQETPKFDLVKVGDRYLKVDFDTNKDAQELILLTQEQLDNINQDFQGGDPVTFYLNFWLDSKIALTYLAESEKDPDFPAWEKQITKQFGPGNAKYILLHEGISQESPQEIPSEGFTNQVIVSFFGNTILASAWGMEQRNRQWAQRIKKVEKNYDIIIVWGGIGHFDAHNHAFSVPMLLNHADVVEFHFEPIDLTTKEESSNDFYTARGTALYKQQLEDCSSIEFNAQQLQSIENQCQWTTINPQQSFFMEIHPNGKESSLLTTGIKTLQEQSKQITGIEVEKDPKVFYAVFVK